MYHNVTTAKIKSDPKSLPSVISCVISEAKLLSEHRKCLVRLTNWFFSLVRNWSVFGTVWSYLAIHHLHRHLMPLSGIGVALANSFEQVGFIPNGVGEHGVTATHYRELMAITVA